MYLTEALKQKDKDKFLEAMVKETDDRTLQGIGESLRNKKCERKDTITSQ